MSKNRIDHNIKLEQYIAKRFKDWKEGHRSYYEKQKRADKPLLDAISSLGKEIKGVTEENKNLINELVPVAAQSVYNYPSTPEETSFERELFTPKTPAIQQKAVDDEPEVNLGPLASRYLSTNRAEKDEVFGLYSESSHGVTQWKIGNWNVHFVNDDIIIYNEARIGSRESINKYKGTKGLWELLTRKQPVDYTNEDYSTYAHILKKTNALYQNNDPTQNRVKSSSSEKYKNIIKPIWNEMKSGKVGSGIKRYTPHIPKEFVWMNDVRKLVDRLLVIAGEEEAGNKNFHNEKVGIMNMITSRLTDFIVTNPKGVGYMIKILHMLPPKFWQGSGFLNDIINKLPFELHIPGYSYCGPGTKLDERLQKGEKGINALDEACREHDIAYKNFKDLDLRHRADKELEMKAFNRVISKDASLGEKAAALGVSMAMNTKTKMGWGV